METFLIRVWASADPDEPAALELHGVALHVATGWERPFGSGRELVDLVGRWSETAAARWAGRAHRPAAAAGDVGTPELDPRRTP